MIRELRTALMALLVMTVLTGLAYPLCVWGIAQAAFPVAANGSVLADGRGSTLIGQSFTSPRYFWGRPSATAPVPYQAMASAGSNLAPTNPALISAVQERVSALRAAHPGAPERIPVDLVTASASGLDPEISVEAALYQVRRVAQARAASEEAVRAVVEQLAVTPWLGNCGEPRVNVLLLNRAIDSQFTAGETIR